MLRLSFKPLNLGMPMNPVSRRVFVLAMSLFSFSLYAQVKANIHSDEGLLAISKKAISELNAYEESFNCHLDSYTKLENKMATAMEIADKFQCVIPDEVSANFRLEREDIEYEVSIDYENHTYFTENVITQLKRDLESKKYKRKFTDASHKLLLEIVPLNQVLLSTEMKRGDVIENDSHIISSRSINEDNFCSLSLFENI